MYAAPRRRSRRSGGGRQPKPWRGGRALPLATLRRRCTIACLTTVRLRTRVCVRSRVFLCVCVRVQLRRRCIARLSRWGGRGQRPARHARRISVVRNTIIYSRPMSSYIAITPHAKLYPPQHHTHSSLRLNGTEAVTPVVVLSGFFFFNLLCPLISNPRLPVSRDMSIVITSVVILGEKTTIDTGHARKLYTKTIL